MVGTSNPQAVRSSRTGRAMLHAMNHVGFMISPELYIVQDEVHGFALEGVR